jgi:hypothetical protein
LCGRLMTATKAVAPVRYHWAMDEHLDMPFVFGQGVVFCPLPDWLKEEQIMEKLSYGQRKELTHLPFALVAEYEADPLNASDSGWTGHTPRSNQAHAVELIHLANLALWLAQPSNIGFEILIHADQPADTWILQQLHNFHPLIPLKRYARARLVKNDFELAKELYVALTTLTNLSREGVIWTVIHALRQALTEQTWVIRYLLLWVALEGLFGPEDAREVTFRLSQRAAFFLAHDRRDAQELFSVIKTGYDVRSKAVHGMRLSKLRKKNSEEIISEAKNILRRSVKRLLTDLQLVQIFEGKGRERYLDHLVFSG